MEGDGNARLILFQTRVLLEVFLQETVHPSLIVILCCTNESDGNYAQIRPINVHQGLLERQKSVQVLLKVRLLGQFTCSEAQQNAV